MLRRVPRRGVELRVAHPTVGVVGFALEGVNPAAAHWIVARVGELGVRSLRAEGDEFYAQHKIDRDRSKAAKPLAWYHTLEFADAQRYAREQGRPLLVEFSSDGCGWCKRLPWVTYRDAAVDARLRQFACVRIDRDLEVAQTAAAMGFEGVPVVVLVGADGRVLHKIQGWRGPAEYARALDKAIAAADLPPVGG